LKLPPTASLADLEKAATTFCGTDWATTLKDGGDPEYVKSYCWYGIYQWNLLKSGYGFEDGKTEITKLDDINGVDLSWTIGAMLSHVAEIEIDEAPKFAFVGLVVANIVGFAILLPLYIWMDHRKRAPRRFSKH
jgi:apyrase